MQHSQEPHRGCLEEFLQLLVGGFAFTLRCHLVRDRLFGQIGDLEDAQVKQLVLVGQLHRKVSYLAIAQLVAFLRYQEE